MNENYKYCDVCKGTWLKKVSFNKAKKIVTSGKQVRVYDQFGNFVDIVKGCSESRLKSEIAAVKNKAKTNTGYSAIIYWVPVKWYDRFTGEEVEPFDTVNGLEEYNRDFYEF